MEWFSSVAILIACCLGVLAVILRKYPSRHRRESLPRQARERFQTQREHLEARFLQLASQSGRPRGLVWKDCYFGDDVVFARDRRSGDLSALVSVTIAFDALEGGGMEEVEAVHNFRAGTAVFQYRDGSWHTQGRAVFNLSPAETVRHFRSSLERVVEIEQT